MFFNYFILSSLTTFVYVVFYKFNLISIKKKSTMSKICSSESDIFGDDSDSDPDFRPGINSDEENSDSAHSDVEVSSRPESGRKSKKSS